jgi:ADP-heptose:LPS heptosyltransferase
MRTVFMLDGGAGRVISAIPAFKKYHKLNPNSDWVILVNGWDFLYWGIPELQDRTYNPDTKGIFDNIIKLADKIITPEPYRNPAYFKQEISLVQAFDREINNTVDHSDLGTPEIVFNIPETLVAKNTIQELKMQQKKQKTVIFQPFGRGAKIDRQGIFDEESRSFSSKDYLYLVKKIASRYNTIFFGEPEYQLNEDIYGQKYTCDLRQWAALINECDYFVGVDSVGQHMARAVQTPGTVIFGSTFPINTSYPDYFQIIDREKNKKYSPIRIAGLDSSLANRYNEKSMVFTTKELDEIFAKIVSDIEKRSK